MSDRWNRRAYFFNPFAASGICERRSVLPLLTRASEIALLRLRGTKKQALIEALGQAGYNVIEIVDTRAQAA